MWRQKWPKVAKLGQKIVTNGPKWPKITEVLSHRKVKFRQDNTAQCSAVDSQNITFIYSLELMPS